MPWKTSGSTRSAPRPAKLQFGHGGDAVENDKQSFPLTAVHVLQFGHGGDAVENARRPLPKRLLAGGFNSATAVMPWKTWKRITEPDSCKGFNSATAVMPWKTA